MNAEKLWSRLVWRFSLCDSWFILHFLHLLSAVGGCPVWTAWDPLLSNFGWLEQLGTLGSLSKVVLFILLARCFSSG